MTGLVAWLNGRVQWLEDRVPRGLLMVPVCVILTNAWQGQPYPFAHAVNAAGLLAVLIVLMRFQLSTREAVSTGLMLLAGCGAAVLATPAGEPSNTARVFIGGLYLLPAVAATLAARDNRRLFDLSLCYALWSDWFLWLIGNTGRGNFGPEYAVSAIGQAYGPLWHPAQILSIVVVYLAEWRNGRARVA